MSGKLIAPRAQQWLRNSRSAYILHLFAEVCNVANDQNEVISLVSPRVGPGPFAVVLEGDFTRGLNAHHTVSIDGARQTLTIGSSIIDIGEAAAWQPRPDWARLRDADVTDWPSAELSPEINRYLRQTLDGIAADNPSTCLTGVEGLAGRGGGLTPTGDDVLMGILYGLWVWYPSHSRRSRQEWLEMIAATAVPRTTTLSANFIRAAADGEAGWHWHDLVNGRLNAIDQILSIGESSGADAWAGFVNTGSTLLFSS